MIRDSSCRALSLFPPSTSFRAALIIAPACRSLGTVSTNHATTAPRSEETMAVRMRKLRVRTDGYVQEQRQLLLPAELADQRHELRRAAVFDMDARPDTRYSRQPLVALGADRDDQLARSREVFEKGLRDFRRCRRDDDGSDRRLVGPAVGAVEDLDRRVVDLQRPD